MGLRATPFYHFPFPQIFIARICQQILFAVFQNDFFFRNDRQRENRLERLGLQTVGHGKKMFFNLCRFFFFKRRNFKNDSWWKFYCFYKNLSTKNTNRLSLSAFQENIILRCSRKLNQVLMNLWPCKGRKFWGCRKIYVRCKWNVVHVDTY